MMYPWLAPEMNQSLMQFLYVLVSFEESYLLLFMLFWLLKV